MSVHLETGADMFVAALVGSAAEILGKLCADVILNLEMNLEMGLEFAPGRLLSR